MKTIKLGRKFGEPATIKDSAEKTHYPTLYLEHNSSEEVPDEGHAMIRYKTRRRAVSQEGDGPKRHTHDIDVTHIQFGHDGKGMSGGSDNDGDEGSKGMSDNDGDEPKPPGEKYSDFERVIKGKNKK